jgi:hypothetical protein
VKLLAKRNLAWQRTQVSVYLLAHYPMLKVLLSIGVYLSLVLVLGFVLALTASRESLEHNPGDDEG